jgi:hypothetical protein
MEYFTVQIHFIVKLNFTHVFQKISIGEYIKKINVSFNQHIILLGNNKGICFC